MQAGQSPESARGPADTASAVRLVLVTAPDREVALRLARGLVTEGLAACVNLVPGVTSVYRWEGEVQEDAEVLLLVKTRGARQAELEAFLRREHPYDVPECVAFQPAAVEAGYLAWLLDACEPGRVAGEDGA